MKSFMHRQGVSLVELMIVMSLSSTLLFIAVGWIHQSMSLASALRSRTDHHATLLRLSRQLRDDVHHGESMSMQGDARLIIAMPDDRRVAYTITPTGISRQLTDADQVTAGEQYSLQSPVSARWDASELPDWISLVVDRAEPVPVSPDPLKSLTTGPNAPPKIADLHVRTGVGRDSRWRTARAEDVQ